MKIRSLLLGSIAMAGVTASMMPLGILSHLLPEPGRFHGSSRAAHRSPGDRAHKRMKRRRAAGRK